MVTEPEKWPSTCKILQALYLVPNVLIYMYNQNPENVCEAHDTNSTIMHHNYI